MKTTLIKGICLLFFINSYVLGQNKLIDSLHNKLNSESDPLRKAMLQMEIGEKLLSDRPDSAIAYFNTTIRMIKYSHISYCNQIIVEAQSYSGIGRAWIIKGNYKKAEIHFEKSLEMIKANIKKCAEAEITTRLIDCKASNYRYIGIIYDERGDYKLSVNFFRNSFNLYLKLNDYENMANTIKDIGIVFHRQGNYEDALKHYYLALKVFDALSNKAGISSCNMNIGAIMDDQGSYNEAIAHYNIALSIARATGNERNTARVLTNIGVAYENMDKWEQAKKFYQHSIAIFKKLNDKYGLAYCYNNMGNIMDDQGNYENAIEYYMKALQIKEEIGAKNGMVGIFVNLSKLYLTKYERNRINQKNIVDLRSAVKYGILAFKLAQELGATDLAGKAAKNLKIAFTLLGDYKQALDYADIFIEIREKLLSQEKINALAETKTKYETEKKELLIDRMKRQKNADQDYMKAQASINNKQRITIYIILSGLTLLVFFTIIVLRLFRQKMKINSLLQRKNEEVNQQKEEIIAQRDEIERQNLQIEEKNLNITSSITYAQSIQQVILPSNDFLKTQFHDFFICYLPKDIVSGDFYWAIEYDKDNVLFATIDCTGHGVPGALMSIIGYNILQKAVKDEKISEPANILKYLNEQLYKTMANNSQGILKEGMDIGLCKLNKKTLQLEFSGVNNTMYLYKNQKINESKGEIFSLGQPIDDNDSFITHKYQLNKGDIIYLFSDGYHDQIGGENQKKFSKKRFKNALESMADKTLETQKKLLLIDFNQWKSYARNEQTDDVVIFAVQA